MTMKVERKRNTRKVGVQRSWWKAFKKRVNIRVVLGYLSTCILKRIEHWKKTTKNSKKYSNCLNNYATLDNSCIFLISLRTSSLEALVFNVIKKSFQISKSLCLGLYLSVSSVSSVSCNLTKVPGKKSLLNTWIYILQKRSCPQPGQVYSFPKRTTNARILTWYSSIQHLQWNVHVRNTFTNLYLVFFTKDYLEISPSRNGSHSYGNRMRWWFFLI